MLIAEVLCLQKHFEHLHGHKIFHILKFEDFECVLIAPSCRISVHIEKFIDIVFCLLILTTLEGTVKAVQGL